LRACARNPIEVLQGGLPAPASSSRAYLGGAERRPTRGLSAHKVYAALAALHAQARRGPAGARGGRAGKENAFADLPHSLEAVEVDGAAQPLGLAEPVHKVRRRRGCLEQVMACAGAACAASGVHSCAGDRPGNVQILAFS